MILSGVVSLQILYFTISSHNIEEVEKRDQVEGAFNKSIFKQDDDIFRKGNISHRAINSYNQKEKVRNRAMVRPHILSESNQTKLECHKKQSSNEGYYME